MYLFRQSFIEVLKTFLTSIVCSLVFAPLISRENALPNAFICFVLNGAACILFLYINFISWSKLYVRTYSFSEYYVPTLVAVLAYTAVSAIAYANRFFLYMWIFLPTRFLEPQLNGDYTQLSIWLTYLMLFIVMMITPYLSYRKR